jgi:hypothetical protein
MKQERDDAPSPAYKLATVGTLRPLLFFVRLGTGTGTGRAAEGRARARLPPVPAPMEEGRPRPIEGREEELPFR